jgi:glycosyltransferase involved in cell wall biosynthesis
MAPTVVNGRVLLKPLTGVARYARSVLERLPRGQIEIVHPPRGRAVGNLWEQLALPMRVPSDGLLWSPANMGPLALRRQVVTLHDVSTLDHPEWFSRDFAAWYRVALPRLVRRVRAILTLSEFSRDRIAHHFPEVAGKITPTHLGVDDAFFQVQEGDVDRVREKYALPETFVLSVGSLEPRKNLRGLVKAWSITDTPPGVELILVGGSGPAFSGAELPELATVRKLGAVPDEDLPGIYRAATLFVYLSLYEGFGLPPLEAMAGGTPVLCSAAGPLRVIAAPAAAVVDPTRPPEIARAMGELLRDPVRRQELAARGREHARRFDWADAAKQTWDVLMRASES